MFPLVSKIRQQLAEVSLGLTSHAVHVLLHLSQPSPSDSPSAQNAS